VRSPPINSKAEVERLNLERWMGINAGAGAVGRSLYAERDWHIRCGAADELAQVGRGTPIGANPHWIASHALALSAVLVSHNRSEFRRIKGLQPVDWAAP